MYVVSCLEFSLDLDIFLTKLIIKIISFKFYFDLSLKLSFSILFLIWMSWLRFLCYHLLQVTQGCPNLTSLDIGYCYRILTDGRTLVTANAFPSNLLELTLHGVQMSSELLIDLVEKLDYIRELTLCGMKAVDDDSLEKVSMELLKRKKTLLVFLNNSEGYINFFKACYKILF